MGTNYYLTPYQHQIHIGKSSAGWKFMFRAHEDIESYSDLLDKLDTKEYYIINEYNEIVEIADFMKIVKERGDNPRRYTKEVGGDDCWEDSQGCQFLNRDFS